ncbi:MAG: NUDIX hydrolase [Anaerolineales bacterium]
METSSPKWLELARELYSISQSGLTYSKSEYDLDRYRRMQEISAEMISHQSGLPKEKITQVFSMQSGYATPKVDVRGAVFRDGKILLVQERADNHWAMPGGWADIGDLPSSMVEREVLEESGLQVRASKVIAVYDANRVEPMEFFHAYKLIFLCELLGGELQTSFETLAVDFFDPAQLPPLSTSRTDERMIAEVLAHLQDSNRPTFFD